MNAYGVLLRLYPRDFREEQLVPGHNHVSHAEIGLLPFDLARLGFDAPQHTSGRQILAAMNAIQVPFVKDGRGILAAQRVAILPFHRKSYGGLFH